MARFKDRRLLLLFSAMMFLMVARAEDDCDNSHFEFSLSCNKPIDPWIERRNMMDIISAGSREACGKELDVSNTVLRRDDDKEGCEGDGDQEDNLWNRSVDGTDEVKTVPDQANEDEELSEEDEKQFVEGLSGATNIKDPIKKGIKMLQKKSKNFLKKGLNLLKKVTSSLSFLGPALDLIIMFMPDGKSDELKAIESGFAQMGARLDAVSIKLESIEGATAYNSIISDLTQFESKVDYLIQKYEGLGAELKVADMSLELPLQIKNSLEDLVSAIKDGGNLGSDMNHAVRIFNGASELNDRKTLIEIYMDAVNNDCSKILRLSSRLMKIVRDAQKLIYLYENTQKLCLPGDDKGYPEMIYKMYKTTVHHYITCTASALVNAKKDMEIRYGDGDSLNEIIDDLEIKYILYNWATFKENDKQSSNFLIRDHASIKSEVELTAKSEDEKEKERLTLFAVTKSTKEQIQDVSDRILKVINALSYDDGLWQREWITVDIPTVAEAGTWDDTVIDAVLELLKKKDSVLKSMVEKKLLTVVMFKNGTDISLNGWHLKTVIKVRGLRSIHGSKLIHVMTGFLFSFEDADEFVCNHGEKIFMSPDKSLPYCVCDIEYGGDNCDILLKHDISESDTVLDIVQKYKVPGMFDIQEDIKKSTNQIMSQIQEDKEEIFKAVHDTRFSIKESENSILYAQSMMMDGIKANSERFLREFDGLKDALNTVFERERNERIYMSEKGNRLVVGTINAANELVTNRIASLTGKVIENRYFETLKFTVPVFEERFSLANEFSNLFAMEDFAEYLRLHEFEFNSAKQAVENAILAESDSFIAAKMQVNMIAGCTDTYTHQIIAAWQELFQLHLSLSTMEATVAAFRIKLSSNPVEKEFLEHELGHLNTKVTAVTDQFKKVYNERGCTGFSMPDLEGGGCKASTTYAGQEIMMTCSDPGKTLAVVSTGIPITKMNCNTDSTWSVDIADLVCVSKCNYNGQIYDVGETRLMELPEKGYRWENDLSTCLVIKVPANAQQSLLTKATTSWSDVRQVDINECLDDGFCGTGSESCSNTPGGFECSCKSGFHVNSESNTGKCEDKNECRLEEIGYTRCLVREKLGTCENVESSYQCSCFAGAYPSAELPGRECKNCQCHQGGVTSQVCDKTGRCLCKDRVGGAGCSTCSQEGYTNFPFCNQCRNGYSGYPNCNKCDCAAEGVTQQICDPGTGVCDCSSEGVGGAQCDSCKATYTNYPLCEKIMVDGTLSSWSSWNSWADYGKCGTYDTKSYQQKRTRRRTCNDSTRNVHGRSCKNDLLYETQSRDHDVCRNLKEVYIRLRDHKYSDTSAKVWAGIKQGDILCTTRKPTWNAPELRLVALKRNAVEHGCSVSFDKTKPIQMYIYSDSSNDMSLIKFGIILDQDDWYWYPGYHGSGYLEIDKGKNNGWWTLT